MQRQAGGCIHSRGNNMIRISGLRRSMALVSFVGLLVGLSASTALAQQTINISSGTISHDICGNAANTITGNCAATNDSDGNTITIGSGVNAAGFAVYGKYADNWMGDNFAIGNQINFGGAAGRVYGSYAMSDAGKQNATAADNTVSMTDGQARGVYGGFAFCWRNCTAEASGNTVSISGGTVLETIVGGNVTPTGSGARGVASNNTVEIKGNAIIDPAVTLYGSFSLSSKTALNNTLELYLSDVAVFTLSDFQNLNFHLPATLEANDTMLAASNTANVGGATIGIGIERQRISLIDPANDVSVSRLQVGEKIVLLDGGSVLGGLPAPANVPGVVTSEGYTFNLSRASNQIVATLMNAPAPLIGAVPAGAPDTTSASFTAASNRSGIAAWRVIETAGGASCSSVSMTVAASGTHHMVAGTPFSVPVSGLRAGTDYAFCLAPLTENLTRNGSIVQLGFVTASTLRAAPTPVPTLGNAALMLLVLVMVGGASVALRLRCRQ